jgi:ABC-type antimicrobial peptide transport system permease subunit
VQAAAAAAVPGRRPPRAGLGGLAALAFAALGVIAGLGAALALTGLLRSLLFEVTSADPAAYAGAAAGLLLVSLLAAWAPVRRALRLDPTEVLRQ